MVAHCPETALQGQQNIAAALFRLDRCRSREELEAVVDDILAWLQDPQQRSLLRAFAVWLEQVLLPQYLPGVVIPKIGDLREVKKMLAEHWKPWSHEWEQRGLQKGLQEGLKEGLQEGLQEGWQKGLQQGRQEGEKLLLIRLLERKFGSLNKKLLTRINKADAETLLVWGERVLTAQDINSVFSISNLPSSSDH